MTDQTRTVSFTTLGCRLNQYETDSLAGAFAADGFAVVDDDAAAVDVCVVNTCSVTGRGEQKSRQAVNRLRRLHPAALLVVTGCAVEREAAQFAAATGTVLVGNDRKHAIAAIARAELAGRHLAATADRFAFAPGTVSLHTRATLKIQDGCDNRCSYCIVPHVRGNAVSRPFDDCLDAARELVRLGYREIVVTGVNIQQYADGARTLVDLVTALLELPGEFRLRLSSIEPDERSPALVKLFENPKLCPHLHLCLQSGADTVLARMHRRYDAADFVALAAALRATRPLFNLTADVIVGYPDETDAEFSATLDVLERCRITHAHTFTFSPREGTEAATLSGRLSVPLLRERSAAVRDLVAGIRAGYLATLRGTTETVLVEETGSDGSAGGYGEHYVPVRLETKTGLYAANTFVRAVIDGTFAAKTSGLTGTPSR